MSSECHACPLVDKSIALTGRFASMPQRDVAALIEELGGRVVRAPRRSTDMLIVGQNGWPLAKEDGQPTANLEEARKLKDLGYAIQIVTEETFFSGLDLIDRQASVRRRYTIGQLSQILDVPRDRIRAWMRAGIIEPVETVHRLAYFDYHQVASARTLCELAAGGLTTSRIRQGLERLRRWLPDVDAPLSQITMLERNGRLLIRLESGHLVEPSGQLQLDFAASDEQTAATIAPEEATADEWFALAIGCEDEGRLEEAAVAYQQAIALEPEDPVLHFNYGNVLHGLQRMTDALAEYQSAVRCDPTYVEAWNNLGSVLADCGDPEQAIQAFHQALQLVPHYADAHYNLAHTLTQMGRLETARHHWQKYVQLDPTSPWADEARRHLANMSGPREA